jgi:3-deoxy-D-manno-octulosonate 8-phosphate phosphatase (KDO 8-P phosphatase)
MGNILAYFKQVKHFVFDIDGVLTDGSLILHPDGTMLRTMNIKDGYAMQLAIKKSYTITIISGANNELAKQRMIRLGLHDIHISVENKLAKLNELITLNHFDEQRILYMGDDMPDIEIMQYVALATCPYDACDEAKQASKYISPIVGGKGCVRDVIEKVMKLNGDWQ